MKVCTLFSRIKILICCQDFYYSIGKTHLFKPAVLPRWCRLADMTQSTSGVIRDCFLIWIWISSLDRQPFLDIFLAPGPWLTSSLEAQLLFFRILLSQAEPGLEHSRGMVVLLVFSIKGTPDDQIQWRVLTLLFTWCDGSEGKCAGVALVRCGAILPRQFYGWGLEAKTGDRILNELIYISLFWLRQGAQGVTISVCPLQVSIKVSQSSSYSLGSI